MSSKSVVSESSEAAADHLETATTQDRPLSEGDLKSQLADHNDHTAPVSAPTDKANDVRDSASPATSISSQESGEASSPEPSINPTADASKTKSAPPLPNEAPPAAEDDGWDFHWDATNQAYFFHNRLTGESTWDNPRIPKSATSTDAQSLSQVSPGLPEPPKNESLPAGGYNPAIHGDYDPNAWYAKKDEDNTDEQAQIVDVSTAYATIGTFNRFTGGWQDASQNPDRHTDEAKSKRQMNAFFDVDAAANSHDGRSLKAERSGKKPSKAELKAFKEKRRARKEEKRRAWLRD
ncbi:hypothetical protein F4778DRAFT_739633 [Xylariomycetidae sp. FL2044]|nr:hypothetical protein F4778DRAFT_739633 [Xylariomycetidae sp. FL2044]